MVAEIMNEVSCQGKEAKKMNKLVRNHVAKEL